MGFLKRWFAALALTQIVFLLLRSVTTGYRHAQVHRLTELCVVQFVMMLASYYFYNYRLYSITIGLPLTARKVVRGVFFTIAVASHSAYFMFYIYWLDGTFVAYWSFVALAFFYHTVVLTLLFYLFELFIENIAGLNDIPLLTSRTLHTMIAIVFAFLLTAYGVSVTRSPPSVHSVSLRNKNLQAAFNGFSIALLTDVHIGPTVGKERIEQIVDVVNKLNVDSVAISGDLVDSFLDNVRPKAMPLKNLESKYGTFFASGNHDYYHSSIDQVLTFLKNDLSFFVLHNDASTITKDGRVLCFAGVDDLHSNALFIAGHGVNVEKALAKCPANSTTILLAHQPNLSSMIIRSSKRPVDLILSGHTHGGQFYIFWLMAWLQNAFLRGLYIYVSAGVNYWGPPVKDAELLRAV
ncbi:putative metallophosphoesterase F40B5.2 [Aphelenchoides fujianensis]|nr:putative metallophosphoesterase F40B5.2 [Aphelenchoides fujianensis]